MVKKLEWREFSKEDSMDYPGAVGDNCKIADFEMPTEKVRELFQDSDMPESAIDEMIEMCRSEENGDMVTVIAVWASEDSDRYYASLEFNGYGGLILGDGMDRIAETVESGEFDFNVEFFC